MAFSSLQAGGTAITLHVGLNTDEQLMVKRETAVGTESPSSKELVLFSLEGEGPCETSAPGPQVKGVSSQSHHSALYPLKAEGVFSTVMEERRKDRGGRGFVHP